jgi:hypothetical protein
MRISSTMPPIVPPTMAPTLSECPPAARAGCGPEDNDVSFDDPLEGPIGGDVYNEDDDDDGVDVNDVNISVESVDVPTSVDDEAYGVEDAGAVVEFDPEGHAGLSGPVHRHWVGSSFARCIR